MTSSIIRIGNSQGVILPADILRQMSLSLKSAISIEVADEKIVIKAAPRQGWAEAAKEMARNGDDAPLMPDIFADENLDWWQWEEIY